MSRSVRTTWTFFTEDAQGRVLVFGALVTLALGLSLRDFYSYQFGFQPDALDYWLLAHGLINGPAFGLNFDPFAPVPTHYPFGFPMLLIPFVLAAPTDFALPQWLSLAATVTSAGILYWGWRSLVPMYGNGWRIAVTAMFLLAPTTISHTRVVLSEPVFTTMVLLALWFAVRLARSPRSLRLWFGLAVACFFMVFVRSIGWVFFASILLYLGYSLRRQLARGILVLVTTFAVLMVPVLVLTPVHIENLIPTQYVEWLIEYGPINPFRVRARNRAQTAAVLSQPTPTSGSPSPTPSPQAPPTPSVNIVLDVQFIVKHIQEDLRRLLLLSGGGELEQRIVTRLDLPGLLILPGAAALLLVLWGNVIWARDTRRVEKIPLSLFQFSTFAYLGITLVWRGGGERLFYPVQPQLYLAMFLGIGALVGVFLRALARLRVVSLETLAVRAQQLVALIVVAWLVLAVYRDLTLRTSYQAWGDLRERTDWIASNIPADAVLLSDWASLDYMMAGRRAVEFPQTAEQIVETTNRLEQNQINYVIAGTDETLSVRGISTHWWRVQAFVPNLNKLRRAGKLVHIYSSPFPFQVFQVVP